MRNPNDFEDLDTFAAAVQAEAVADVHRSDFEWAIGGTAPNERHLEVEYGIEPSRGDGAREISDELYDAVHGLPDYRDGVADHHAHSHLRPLAIRDPRRD